MKWLDTEAVPVGRRRLSGADRMVTLLTPEYGRLAAVSRGACLPKSPLGSALEPYCVSRLILTPARSGGLYRVDAADAIRRFDGLSRDLSRMQAAGLVCAWSRAVSREEPQSAAYGLLCVTLEMLDDPDRPVAPVVAGFLWRLAAVSGVAPRMASCVACGGGPPFTGLRLQPGGALCAACGRPADISLDAPAWDAVRALTAGISPDHIPGGMPEPAARRLTGLAQRYLRTHFGDHLP